jgi:hypothetical protein
MYLGNDHHLGFTLQHHHQTWMRGDAITGQDIVKMLSISVKSVFKRVSETLATDSSTTRGST